jgi:type VI secretion system FHA domain protein
VDAPNQKPLDAFFEAPEVKPGPPLSKPPLKEEASLSASPPGFGIPEDWDTDGAHKPLPPLEDPFAELPASAPQVFSEPPSDEIFFAEKNFEERVEPELKQEPKKEPKLKPEPAPVQAEQPPLKEEKVVVEQARSYPENFKAMQFGAENIEELVAEKWLSMLPDILDGMMASMRSRAEIKNEMRVDKTMLAAAENNPLKFSVNAQSAANNLFVDKSGSFLSPEQAFNEAFHDIQVHQIALMTAMQHTIREMMERFNPKKLEQRFEKGMKRKSLFGGSNKSAYWDLYTERYNELCEDSDKLFHELVSDVFAEAYEKAARELK